ncbi:jg27609, partial [Pararge aegeria aegeria]
IAFVARNLMLAATAAVIEFAQLCSSSDFGGGLADCSGGHQFTN